MKRPILLLLVLVHVSMSCFSQSTTKKTTHKTTTTNKIPYISNGFLFTTIEDGAGLKIKTSFEIKSAYEAESKNQAIEDIRQLRTYKEYCIKNGATKVSDYLKFEIDMAALSAKYQMTNMASFAIVKESAPDILVFDDKLIISFTCKSQNGFGSYIVSSVDYLVSWDDTESKEVVKCQIK
jgi:hypothetical protein